MTQPASKETQMAEEWLRSSSPEAHRYENVGTMQPVSPQAPSETEASAVSLILVVLRNTDALILQLFAFYTLHFNSLSQRVIIKYKQVLSVGKNPAENTMCGKQSFPTPACPPPK